MYRDESCVLLDTNNSLHNSSKYLLNPKNTGPVGHVGNANIIMSFSIMEHNEILIYIFTVHSDFLLT